MKTSEQKIIPTVWCNGNADEIADFYCRVFDDAAIVSHRRYPEEGLLDFQQPFAGKTLTIEVALRGYRLLLINADDTFTPNPTISFMVSNSSRDNTRALYEALAVDGQVLMPLESYDFNPFYAWVQDKFGVSWQLFTHEEPVDLPPVYPSIMFCGAASNRAAEALSLYTKVFGGSVTQCVTYGDMGHPGNEVISPASVVFATCELLGQTVGMMDSAVAQPFTFGGGIALMVSAHGQEEIDRYFEGLSADPAAERCGWLKDPFGVSWQVVPDNLEQLMSRPNAYEKLMSMTKIVIDDF